jgi:hypothetical protein
VDCPGSTGHPGQPGWRSWRCFNCIDSENYPLRNQLPRTAAASHSAAARLTHGSCFAGGAICHVYIEIGCTHSPLNYAEMLDMLQLLYAKKLQAACVHLSYAEMLQHATTSIC